MTASFLILSVLIVGVPSLSAFEEQNISISYEVFYGGIRATSLDVDIIATGHTFRLESNAVAKGPFGWLTGFVSHAVTEGSLINGQLHLRQHNVRSEWFGEQRSVALRPGEGGIVDALVVPTPDKDDRDPVVPTSTIGTYDPLSASFKAAQEIQRADACDLTLPIYDGRRRYDLVFRDTVRTSVESAVYSGPALRCRLDLKQIGGFSRKPVIPRPETPPEAFIWLAQINEGGPLLPIRLQVDSSVATTMIHLTRVGPTKSN
ncbi:MAG: DUF3108 domain-containing protein [Proteobacteria bacterium]|nr:DUF3108 domain-containing protein [Pseudomonadota bacterium]